MDLCRAAVRKSHSRGLKRSRGGGALWIPWRREDIEGKGFGWTPVYIWNWENRKYKLQLIQGTVKGDSDR